MKRIGMALALATLALGCRPAPPSDFGRPCGYSDGGGADAAFGSRVCSEGLTCTPAGSFCVVGCNNDGHCAELQNNAHSASAVCNGGSCRFLCDGDGDCPLNLRCTADRVCGL